MKFLKIYFYLFLASLLVSQSLMDLFSTLFCLQWVWIWWQERKAGKSQSLLHAVGLEAVFMLWWLICAIGFALTWIDPEYAAIRLIEFKWIFIFYVMIEILGRLRPNRNFLGPLTYLIFISAVVNLFLYFADFEFLHSLRYGAGAFLRAGGLFVDPMTFAQSFALPVCLLLGITVVNFRAWPKSMKWFVSLTLFLAVLGLVLTFTRGVWIGLLFGILVTLLAYRPKYFAVVFATILVCGLTAYQSSEVIRWRVDRTWQEAGGASERKLLWQAHFLEFKENPIFGLGYGQNGKLLPEAYAKLGIPADTLVSHAHNQYIHLAAGTGLLGLACYLFIWFFILRLLWRLWKRPDLDSWDQGIVLGAAMAMLTFLVAGLTEANFEHSKVRFMVMILWSYVIYLGKEYRLIRSER
jgi:O-antigen ligase